jgi:hypothetical protein
MDNLTPEVVEQPSDESSEWQVLDLVIAALTKAAGGPSGVVILD